MKQIFIFLIFLLLITPSCKHFSCKKEATTKYVLDEKNLEKGNDLTISGFINLRQKSFSLVTIRGAIDLLLMDILQQRNLK